MKTVLKTRLKIRDQHELLNQIAGTYKDFFRASMEYVDNAVDAAAMVKKSGSSFDPLLTIIVDSTNKSVSFTDNCGGMSPQELCDLLSEVGRSKKKTVPWANGQFGFGVHAFRAFAKQAVFISKKSKFDEASIKIDKSYDENTDVPCELTSKKHLDDPGTRVTISKFEPHVFKKSIFIKALTAEIERHFEDVLRAGLIKIIMRDGGSSKYQCQAFDYERLPGTPYKKDIKVNVDGKSKVVHVDLKVLERNQENRLPVVTNKQRRVQSISDLKSYKNYAREHMKDVSVWSNPFLVGFIEISDICSPNLTRDDLKDSSVREELYSNILDVQKDVEELIDKVMNSKSQESFQKLGSVMSDCLSRIMKSFRLHYEQTAPSSMPGEYGKIMIEEDGQLPFGGDDAGGGGTIPGNQESGGAESTNGTSGVGTESDGGGLKDKSKSAKDGLSKDQLIQSPGPRIEFQNHSGADRVINLGNSLVVNTLHPDFIKRNTSKSGKIRLDTRLLNYVSMIIAPECVHKLFEKKGKVPSPLEVGSNVIDLGLRLEQELSMTVLNQEIESTI